MLSALAGTAPDSATGVIPLLMLFNIPQGWAALRQFQSGLGTATSGPLGTMVLSFFVLSLTWTWVRHRFDTWSMWDVFLRLFITAAGIAAWDTLFWPINDSLSWLATGMGQIDPCQCFYDVALKPFLNLTINGVTWGDFLTLSIFSGGLLLMALLQFILQGLTIAIFSLSVLAQQFTIMFLYLIGPLFLACYVFDPLQDLWMRWVRFFLTIKVWSLVMNFTLFLYSSALSAAAADGSGFTTNLALSFDFLLLIIFSLCASLPIARALVGGAAAPFFNGASAVHVASTAAQAVPAAVTAGAVAAAV